MDKNNLNPGLRDYQINLIQGLRERISNGDTRNIAVLPTGGGKTFVFCSIAKSAFDRGRRVLILTDRVELMKQAGGSLRAFGLEPITIEAGRSPYLKGSLYTAMIETMKRRLDKPAYRHFLASCDLVIIDECHNRNADKLMPFFRDDAKILGFTATPSRMGRKNQLGELYESLTVGIGIDSLVKEGWLSTPEYYGVKTDLSGIHTKRGDWDQKEVADRFSRAKVYRGVVDNWEEHSLGRKTLVFASNIANSREVVEEFLSRGHNARHLDADVPKGERAGILEWFKETPGAILSNCGILTTGFDEPTIETVILYRATKSLTLFLQMCGRGSRVHEPSGKTKFQILDFGNNILTHGFWHEPRTWTLDQDGEERPIGAPMVKNCEECEAFIPIQAIVCPECGHVHEKAKHEQETARLQLLDPREARMEADRGDLTKKAALCRAGVVKAHYVLHNLRSFEDVKKFVDMMGYSPWWYQYNHNRFWWSDNYLEEVRTGSRGLKKELI